MRRDAGVRVYQEKIAPPRRESAGVLLCQRTIQSLEQDNACLKERQAQILRNRISKAGGIVKVLLSSTAEILSHQPAVIATVDRQWTKYHLKTASK
jgi:hypothetical protein